MSSDSKKKPGRGFASTARASAISKFVKTAFGVTTVTSADRGAEGVRVTQERYATWVCVRVTLVDETEGAEWSTQIETKLSEAGYVIGHRVSPLTFYVSRTEWQIDDKIASGIGMGGAAMESDAGMLAAFDYVVNDLRSTGWVQPGTRLLTEEGEAVRERLVAKRKATERAEVRRLRQRGW